MGSLCNAETKNRKPNTNTSSKIAIKNNDYFRKSSNIIDSNIKTSLNNRVKFENNTNTFNKNKISNIYKSNTNSRYIDRLPSSFSCFQCGKTFDAEPILLQHIQECINTDLRTQQSRLASLRISSSILRDNPFNPDRLLEYIDWKYKFSKETGISHWINNGIIKQTDLQIKDIFKLSNNSIKTKNFWEKRAWFNEFINNEIYDRSGNYITLVISRENVLQDSYNQIKTTPNLNIKNGLKIYFIDEVAQDVGGVFREWYTSLFKEIFNVKKYNFFNEVQSKYGHTTMFFPSSKSINLIEGTEEEYYEFIGKVIAKGIYDKSTLKYKLNRIILINILGIKPELQDLKFYDLEIYESLDFILNNSVAELYMPFSYNIKQENNILKEIELCENGLEVMITESNKHEYVEKVVELLSYTSIKSKIDNFNKGFFSVIDKSIIKIFTVDELDFIISGQLDIDINDWKQNTIYKGHYNSNHKIIKWFWDIMETLNKADLLIFFKFCTGCTKVPVDGFNSLTSTRNKYKKFCIESRTDISKLIEAMTCFNRLYIPLYDNKSRLEEVIKVIINNNTDFFGIE